MNNLEREERRKLHERREEDLYLPEYPNRAHRACERECIDLKDRIKALEYLLARSGTDLQTLVNHCRDEGWDENYLGEFDDLVEEIDAILPDTEGEKDAHIS